jgi:RNase P/RNase MRP subunit p29
MKTLVLATALTLAASLSFAANTYQVTGPVLAIKGNTIVVQKGSEKWEVDKDAATKISGELKVGAKVTIEYRMTATKIEVKSEKPAPAKKK